MTALWTAARHEVSYASRNRTFRLAAAIVTALLLVSFSLELLHHRAEGRERSALQQRVDAEWRNQPDRHPHRAAHYGLFVFRPLASLGFIDPGLGSYSGSATFLEPHQRNLSSFSEAAESSELARFGRPSAAFVLQVLVPLLLFCITFSSVAGEREAGTWSLAISQGVHPRTLLAGKALGLFGAVSAWLLLVLGVAFAGATAVGALEPSWDTLARAALLSVGYLLYLGFCAGLGVWVSSLHQRAHAALLSLLALWVSVWIVVPRLATSTATELHPAPSRARLEADIASAVRELGDSHDPDNAHYAELRERTLERFQATRVEDLPINYGGVVMAEAEKASSGVFNQFHNQLQSTYRAQDALALQLGGYTPLLAMRSLSMALAGTDGHHLADFDARVEAYRYQFVQHLNELHTTKIRWQNDRGQRVDRSEWQQFAPFSYRQPTLGAALSSVLGPALALTLWAALLGIGLALVYPRSVES